jgi:uncharacterized membrane protein SirB2
MFAEFYLPLKQLHMALAALSVSLFSARALAALAGAGWPLTRGVRSASMAVDSLLLAAGVGLWALLSLRPDRDPWLLAKLALLVGYIVLGSLALRRARTGAGRVAALLGAWVCVAAIVAVALAHDPAAPLRVLGL